MAALTNQALTDANTQLKASIQSLTAKIVALQDGLDNISVEGVVVGDSSFTALQTTADALEDQLDDIEAGSVGDLLYHGSGGVAKLPIGTAGYQLTSSGTTPQWSAPVYGSYSPKTFGAVGDGSHDDYDAIVAMHDAIGSSTISREIRFPPGTYKVRQAVVWTLDNCRISGPGATITFQSSDTALTGTSTYDSLPANQRSAFFIKASDVTIEGIAFQGDSVQTDISINSGVAVAASHACHRLRMRDVVQKFGGGLVSILSGSEGARIRDCYSYGSRANSRVGNDGAFIGCHFELPFTAEYDRVSNAGSSHGIYQYASSGNRVKVRGCTFTNIRLDGAKMSGSNLPLRGFSVTDGDWYNCGYNSDGTNASGSCVMFGVDDYQSHAMFTANGNRFHDSQQWFTVLGGTNINISRNQGNRTILPGTPSNALIQVTRYGTGTQPVDSVIIQGNQASSECTSNQTFTVNATTDLVTTVESAFAYNHATGWPTGFPVQVTSTGTSAAPPGGLSAATTYYWIYVGQYTGRLATSKANALAGTYIDLTSVGVGVQTFTFTQTYTTVGIDVEYIGDGCTNHTSPPLIIDNLMGIGCGTDVQVTGGVNPVLRGNSGDGGLFLKDCRMPRLSDHLVSDAYNTNTAVIRMQNVSWPQLDGHFGSNRVSGTNRVKGATGDNAGGSTSVFFPLSGRYGRVTPSQGIPEVVFAYGSGWATGDTLNINGTTITYGTDFTDLASLIAKLNGSYGGGSGLANFTCADYGAPWSIVTAHLRLRWYQADSTANKFYIENHTKSKSAGVILTNGNGGGQTVCYSRGEGTNQLVLWGQCFNQNLIPDIRAENAAAAAALALGIPYPVAVDFTLDATSNCVMQLGAGTIGTGATFQWRL